MKERPIAMLARATPANPIHLQRKHAVLLVAVLHGVRTAMGRTRSDYKPVAPEGHAAARLAV